LPEIKIPFSNFIGSKFSYHLFPILLPFSLNRDGLIEFLSSKGIQTSIHYKPIHKLKFYERRNFKLKNLDKISNFILSLPIYPNLSFSDQNYVIKAIKEYLKYKK
jgi:dTDP-4-amino-4,6-dideoxygalactose transaminase